MDWVILKGLVFGGMSRVPHHRHKNHRILGICVFAADWVILKGLCFDRIGRIPYHHSILGICVASFYIYKYLCCTKEERSKFGL